MAMGYVATIEEVQGVIHVRVYVMDETRAKHLVAVLSCLTPPAGLRLELLSVILRDTLEPGSGGKERLVGAPGG